MTMERHPAASPDPVEAAPASGSISYLVRVCLVATLGGLLFGYDTAVISGAIGFLKQHFSLTPALVGWAASSALAGCVVGAALAGTVSDHFGRRKVLIASAVLFVVSAVGTAVPRSLAAFIIFRFIGGIGVGSASMTSPLYIAEVSPARIRGRMVSLNQFAIIFGMLVIYFVNYFIAGYGTRLDERRADDVASRGVSALNGQGPSVDDRLAAGWSDGTAEHPQESIRELSTTDAPDTRGLGRDSWNVTRGWRWMFGSETLPAMALLILMFAVPESPRWLIKQRRQQEALAVLTRINGPAAAKTESAAIEKAIESESGSIRQLFMPGMSTALLIGVSLAVFQQVTGINVFLYYAPEIFKNIAGADSDIALLQTVVVGLVNLGFTVIAILTVDRLGRKPLMIAGFTGMGASLAALGLTAYHGRTDAWVLIFILGYIASFAISVGPVTWVILAEIFPTKVRGRALAIATVCLWAANYAVSQTFPMIEQSDWLIARFHNAFPFWLYGMLCGAAILFVWLFVPETKRKSLEEIERLWQRR